MIKYYRKYKSKNQTEITNQIATIQESLGGPVGPNGPSELDGVPLGEIYRINIPLFLTQNIEDLGIYEDVGKTESELNNK